MTNHLALKEDDFSGSIENIAATIIDETPENCRSEDNAGKEEESKEQEDSFPERVEATQLVRDLRKQLLEAEDDLADKKKVQTVRKIIKIHCICNLVFTGNQAAWSANSRHKEDYAKGDEGHDDDVAGGAATPAHSLQRTRAGESGRDS